jgi:DNA-binding MarR family transcriptional regulator
MTTMVGSKTRRSTSTQEEGSGSSVAVAATAALRASRALVAIAARSMAGMGDITVPQYRALVVLSQRGPQRAGDLAEALGVQPSTLTRLADRLVHKGLIERRTAPTSRREVEICLAEGGQTLVADVARRRTEELLKVLHAAGPEQRQAIISGLDAFADAAGEFAEEEWVIPWS